jgi:RNase P/RNase MRP subunit p30
MANDITLFRNPESLFFVKIKKKEDITSFDFDGFLIDADEKECRRTIEYIRSKNKSVKIAVIGIDDEFNRRAVETLKINYLVSPEITWQNDSLKQRSSGLNHVVAKIAKDKNIIFVSDISLINKQNDKKNKAILISRIIQNIKICRKAKCEIKLASFAKDAEELIDEKQAMSIAFSLGMSSQQAKTCFNY